MEDPTIKGEAFKEIVILERTRFNGVDDLARFASIAVGGKTTGVYWANGVVFIYYPLPTSTEVAAKALIEEKKVYWAFVSYALMPKYMPIIETKERIMVIKVILKVRILSPLRDYFIYIYTFNI